MGNKTVRHRRTPKINFDVIDWTKANHEPVLTYDISSGNVFSDSYIWIYVVQHKCFSRYSLYPLLLVDLEKFMDEPMKVPAWVSNT